MLGSVKDSIINAYEIKTGLSRTKLSHMMDAETWMDCPIRRWSLDLPMESWNGLRHRRIWRAPEVTMLYSKAAVRGFPDGVRLPLSVSLVRNRQSRIRGRTVDELMERLNLLKR